MLLKDLVKRIQQLLVEVLAKQENIQNDEFDFIADESRLTIAELQRVLDTLASSELQATAESVHPFLALFTNRYVSRISRTPAIYHLNMNTHANQIYLAIAAELKQITGKDECHLLYPNLDPALVFTKPLNQYIESSDGKSLIDVLECYEKTIERRDRKFFHTHPVNGKGQELNEDETLRLNNFSSKSQKVFKSIVETGSAKTTLKALKTALTNKEMWPIIVLDQYGVQGRERLARVLMPNFDQVFVALENRSDKTWRRVTDLLDIKELKKYILDQKITYKQYAETLSQVVENALQYRIGQLCAVNLYRREREAGQDYIPEKSGDTLFGYSYGLLKNVGAYLLRKYNKEEKIIGADILMDFWMQDKIVDWNVFFADRFEAMFGNKLTADEYAVKFTRCKGAVEDGDLGDLAKQAKIPYVPAIKLAV